METVENNLWLNQEESAIHEQELLCVLKERLNKIVAKHNGQATDEIDQKVCKAQFDAEWRICPHCNEKNIVRFKKGR